MHTQLPTYPHTYIYTYIHAYIISLPGPRTKPKIIIALILEVTLVLSSRVVADDR